MLQSCSTTLRQCVRPGRAAASRGPRTTGRSTCVVVKADASNGAAPQHVLEARAWIDGWKFQQVKVSSLEEGIVKAAEFLEGTKNVRNARRDAEAAAARRTVRVTVTVKKAVKYGCSLKLVGSAPEMGAWTPAAAPPMKWAEGDVWSLGLDLKAGTYDFKVVTAADNGEAEWEDGENRVVQVPVADKDGTSLEVELQAAASPELAGTK